MKWQTICFNVILYVIAFIDEIKHCFFLNYYKLIKGYMTLYFMTVRYIEATRNWDGVIEKSLGFSISVIIIFFVI